MTGAALPGQRTMRIQEVRWLRDLVRTSVLRKDYPDGQLPSETELMVAHDVTRSTVREALATLRAEGLIERTQGIGTHVVARSMTTALDEALGVAPPAGDSILNHRLRPQVLDHSIINAPKTVAARLAVPQGTQCLRLDYLSLLGDEMHGLATNYVLFPEAEQILRAPFISDWYALLGAAGIEFHESEFVIGCVTADPILADMLRVAAGVPLLMLEQTITDTSHRIFDFAIIHTPANRFRFASRAHLPIS